MSYFVYVYNTDDGVPYYVGKGCKTRHINRRRHTVQLPTKENIQIFHCDTEQEAYDLEIFLIEFFVRKLDGGILDNLSLGGPGCKGYKATPKNGYKKRGPRVKSKSDCPPTPSILDRPCLWV